MKFVVKSFSLIFVVVAFGFFVMAANAGNTFTTLFNDNHDNCFQQLGSDIESQPGEYDYSTYDESQHNVDVSSGDSNCIVVGLPGSGRALARVYRYQSNEWVQQGQDIDWEPWDDCVAYWTRSVAISDDCNRVAVGANFYPAGHARVHHYQDGEWVQVGFMSTGWDDTHFGSSVSMSGDGNRIAVGLPSAGWRGRAQVYQYEADDEWEQLGNDLGGEAAPYDEFGHSVAISNDGNRIVVGALGLNGGSGYAGVYQYTEGEWVQLGDDIHGEAEGDHFGSSVAISGDGSRIVVGAPLNDDMRSDSGHARVYQYHQDDEEWVQLGDDINGKSARENFGNSVSMSEEGNRIVVGAPSYNARGYVRVFDYVGDEWVRLGDGIYGKKRGDEFGTSVAISGDGNFIAADAPKVDTYNSLGRARVFSPCDDEQRV